MFLAQYAFKKIPHYMNGVDFSSRKKSVKFETANSDQ